MGRKEWVLFPLDKPRNFLRPFGKDRPPWINQEVFPRQLLDELLDFELDDDDGDSGPSSSSDSPSSIIKEGFCKLHSLSQGGCKKKERKEGRKKESR